MRERFAVLGLVTAIGAFGSGCGGNESDASGAFHDLNPAQLSGGDIQLFALASAPTVFGSGIGLLAAVSVQMAPTCPKKTTSGSTTTYEGGCTDPSGMRWMGKASIDGANSDSGKIVYDAFGMGVSQPCGGGGGTSEVNIVYDGTTTFTALSSVKHQFVVEVTAKTILQGSCGTGYDFSAFYDYTGDVEAPQGGMGVDIKGPTTWNGSGRVGYSIYGFADVSTKGEVLDSSKCSTEAVSGATTIRAGSDTAVVTYDGATSCQQDSTVTWTLNGEPQGELSHVQCSAAPSLAARRSSGAPGMIGAVAIALGALTLRRRRLLRGVRSACPLDPAQRR